MQSFQSVKKDPKLIAQRVFGLLENEMKLVEADFKSRAASNIQVINYLSEYLRESGGKRIRPTMLLLANGAAGGNSTNESVIRLATVMEMIHTATLVHDDIIDNAQTRRNAPSVNARFGNQASVLMGDWLYMTAFEVSLGERNLELLDILTNLTKRMTEGELIQLTVLGRSDLTEETYFEILRRKTAYLFSACCEIGAILAGATKERQEALKSFGMNLGTAFQLADDLMDFTSDDEVMGKASGADLIEGKLTLPLLLLVEKDPSIRKLLDGIMLEGAYKGNARQDLLKRLKETGALEATNKRAHEFAAEAKRNIEILPETEYRLALEDIPALMIDRKS
ncbi:MAG: polyprenyl synthetase family protein [Pyrinomonadaceae bacterium]|nr:polyprenyl synthetase family protein [Pyrinomonadaceae bacterium]